MNEKQPQEEIADGISRARCSVQGREPAGCRVRGARHGDQRRLAPMSDGSSGGGRSALGCSARSGFAHLHNHPLSITGHITGVDEVQDMTNVRGGKEGLVPLMNSDHLLALCN